MCVVILLICFVSIFFSIGIFKISAISKKEVLIISVLVFSLLVVAITELTSALNCLNFLSILILWGVITFANVLYLYINKQKVITFSRAVQQAIYKSIKNLTLAEKLLCGGVSVILLLIFIQAIVYPPNNWDSMTYHMARITSWVSHQSVAHYPTHIVRQLYQPPFAEYVIMHLAILARGDYFSNLVQFFYLLFSLVSIVLIIESFGLNRQYKIIGLVLGATIPEVVLQASSTQNDIIVSFFIITAFYFSVKAIKYCKPADFLFLGLTIGLGALTKGTAYLYFAPFVIFLGVGLLIAFFKAFNYKYLGYPAITLLVFIGINAGNYYRNYQFTQNVLGVDKVESRSYSNQKMSVTLFFSNVIKNIGLHTSMMYINGLADASGKVIDKLHSAAGISTNAPGANYRDTKFTTNYSTTSEDSAPNFVHLLLTALAFAVLLFSVFKKQKAFVNPLLFIIILQVVLFCLYLKWQPWHTRLHTTLFLMAIPLLCYAFSVSNKLKRVFYILSPILLIYALLMVLHNNNRPYNPIIFESRYQKYFIDNPYAYQEYNAINKSISQANYTNIGLNLGIDDWEYPLFTDCFSRKINPVYIQVNNLSKNLPQSITNVDCIVATNLNKQFIDFNGKRFYNQTSGNKLLYLYK
jgi:hypothetical protein